MGPTRKNVNPKMVNNDELQADVTRYTDEVNNVRYWLGNIEKVKKDMNKKIDKLLEGEKKIDTLIEQGKKLLELSENRWNKQLRKWDNDKNETTRKLNEHSKKLSN